MIVRESTRRAEGRERPRVPWPNWRRRRLPWLVAALACVLAAALASFLLPPPQDPWQPEGNLTSSDFWLASIETNAFRRLPAVGFPPFFDLNRFGLATDGRTILAAGRGGSVLHNWSLVISGTESDLYSVALAADGKTALAVGIEGTILRSSDGGVTWSRTTSGTKAGLASVALAADGTTGLAVGEAGTILRSSDGGASWSAVTSGTKATLACVALVADGETALAVDEAGTILRSADGGTNWSPVASGAKASLNFVTLATNGRTALALGDKGIILRSSDGGASWSPVYSGTKATLMSLAVATDGKTALAADDEGTILRSNDSGASWSPVSSDTYTTAILVALPGDGRTALAVGYDGTVLRGSNGGAKWSRANSTDKASLNSVALARDGRTALAGSRGAILRSTDGGANWSPVISSTKEKERAAVYAVALTADGGAALAVENPATGEFLRSSNGGDKWSARQSTTIIAGLCSVALAPDGSTALAVGDEALILKSSDGGATWSEQSVNFNWSQQHPNDFHTILLYSVALSADGRTALAVGDEGTILRSSDGGASWSPVTSGTEERLTSVALAGNGRTALAVGTRRTILRSSDGGANWSSTASGASNSVAPATDGFQATLRAVALAADGTTALAVGDEGTVLRSSDGGARWSPVTANTEATLNSVGFAADGKTALAVGEVSTILRSSNGGITWNAPTPHRAPPRIAWVLWAGGFLVLLPAFVSLPSVKLPPKTIGELLATDRPLRRGDRDATGYADQLARQIGSFLRNAQTAPPLTIAIVGPWGSGKSSVLSRLRDELVAGGQRPVLFNAWHRRGEESIFAALMQAVRAEAVPPWWSLTGLDVRFHLLLSRIRTNPVAWLLMLLLLAGMVGFATATRPPGPAEALTPLSGVLKEGKFTDLGKKLFVAMGWPLTILVGLLIIIGGLRDRLSSAGLDPGRLLAAAGRATRWRDLGVQLAFRDRFKQALSEVTAALGRRTLTIVIDDLDRCRPDQIAEVLEAINFLTDADGCFVVFGFSRPQVLAGVGLANREIAVELAGGEDTPEIRKAYAEDYLRKLIQIEVPVPRFSAPAAERLVDVASEISAELPFIRAWLPALAGFGLMLWVGVGIWGGHHLYWMADNEAAIMSSKTTLETPQGKPVQMQLTQPPSQASSPAQQHLLFSVYSGESASLPLWVLLVLIPALGLAVLAAAVEANRPHATSDNDSKDFTDALHHWAVAAYEVRQSPREMKRFLNRLRFAAAGRAPDLPDDTLVGLAVLQHAGAEAELANVIETGASGLHDAIECRAKSSIVFAHILEALDPAALARSHLPPFEPTAEQTTTFLALWEGVKVEA